MSALVPMLLAAAAAAPSQAPAPAPAADPAAETKRARAAFAALDARAQAELIDFLESELAAQKGFQASLATAVLARQERDPSQWPKAQAAPHYDPVKHAPAQPIARVVLSEKDRRVRAASKSFGLAPDARAWSYDWASGDVLRRASVDLGKRAFDLALAGRHPRQDLVEALVLRALDDGAERKSLAAFAHAYTDRAGLVYSGITLYDAWGSGREIEMPDVDCLGLVHDVLGDWSTWRSVIPAAQHEPLYRRIGELYAPARAHRELRAAIGRAFLCGESVGPTWDEALDNLHALWEDCESTPATLAARLPTREGTGATSPDRKAPDWKAWLAAWVATCHERGEMFQRGRARRATLVQDGAAVRATLLRVLEEYGAQARASNEPGGG